MKLFLDTANDDFVIAAFDNNFNLVYSEVIKKYQKKVELIPTSIKKMLEKLHISIDYFDEFYTNLGPGYFTGVRISLVYLRTIATIKKIPIFTISSMQIMSQQKKEKDSFFINAKGEKYFEFIRSSDSFNVSQISCKQGVKDEYDEINYDNFLNNFKDFRSLFKSYKNNNDIEPYYIKLPQIGAKK
ncbi:tRNA (adenosine(37)-N6)-threonylcarbamoyltransferase complex dimerization subunit type 1 TsaB [Mycoplasma tauri]|uniref:tRNA (adenosine(37)-N6)-threonylcarbamoyltransferase complex dimerization subunit type 1 TsaB n=2 Tax=Mycoplasma tauri TaxID=547987 RepID=UPI001968193A|nr:tRNA (adenosine(37)-N6)-threonylcarbamoyltransferase complex dimerization subunit type 1 TsaB [Mycoplasma tauri]MBZ4204552.1 tRNA (adenosine(37)-N6)-threonylcarbamoyltransferase complex dimerization subunit type 1 TsaB [Mycoplasma tauri]MBZ4226927.1 tRNA (adenosine(37)-N6)-threonylcarbamoyltransferase complex dimerization subunit type 1 TsaB [Mycoplasma tauri]QSB07791.1 tRNA (adenosine(37)-N6)-threonylcarbamoyltransferase complex dimerization subunit type 1 TsaB [Mycoplasma tauri]